MENVSLNFQVESTSVICYGEKDISYIGDSLITFHHWEGKQDKAFRSAIKTARSIVAHPLHHEWRLFLALQLISQALARCILLGRRFKYVECGVGEGHLILTAYHYFRNVGGELFHKFNSGEFLLMDTFNGVDMTLISQNDYKEYKSTAYYGATLDIMKKRLTMYRNLQIIEGSIPSTLSKVPKESLSPDFLHIDMNNEVPEVAALKFFRSFMKSGAVILLDDYSFQSAYRQREAINRLCRESFLVSPINLPTGQGLIIC